jgi:lipoprotein NlpD
MYKRLKANAIPGSLIGLVLLCAGCGSHVYHQVRPDDTLYSIGWRYGLDYRQIASWNGIASPYVIHQGDWLRVAPPRNQAVVRSLTTVDPPKSVYATPSAPATVVATPKQHIQVKPEPISRDEVTWLWPVKGRVVEKFNANSPAHQGIDISAPLGAPVYAAAAGKVVYSGNGLKGYGNLVIIKHNDKYLSAYGHNQRILVTEGAMVAQGDVIARVGDSEAERVQLHFQIRIDGKPVDPLHYLP